MSSTVDVILFYESDKLCDETMLFETKKDVSLISRNNSDVIKPR